MDRQQIGMKLTLDGLGLPFQLETFEDRLILQKAIYLAQAAGVRLGYYFRWYLRGPYCPALTADAYAVASEPAQGSAGSGAWHLDDGSAGILARIRPLFEAETPGELARQLELLASVHYLLDRRQVPSGDARRAAETLERFGKDFHERDVQCALGRLAEHGLSTCNGS